MTQPVRKKSSAAPLISAAQFGALADISSDLLCIMRLDGRLEYANQTFLDSLGYVGDDIIASSLFELIHTDDRDFIETTFKQAANAAIDKPLEFQCRSKDGRYRWLQWQACYDDTDKLIYSVAQDITEQKYESRQNISTDKQMQWDTLATQLAIDNAGDSIFMTSSHGNIMYVNETGCRSLGYSREELLQMTVRDVSPGLKDSDWDDDENWQAISDGKPHTHETRHQRKDGHIFPVEIITSVIEIDGKQYGCNIVRDITQRKKQEKHLLFLQYALNNAGDSVYLVNKKADIIYANNAASNSSGYSNEELLAGMRIHDLDPSVRNGTTDWDKFRHSIADGTAHTFEVEHQRKDGSLFPVEVTAMVTEFAGEEFICSFERDITVRKKAARQMEELRFAIENAIDAVYISNENGDITYANISACTELGYSLDELTVMNVTDIDLDYSRDSMVENRELASKGLLQTVESVHRRKDGTTFAAEITFSVNEFDGKRYSCAFARNITERKLAARKMEELLFAFDNAVDAVYMSDKEGKIYYVNAAACRELGYSHDELTKMNVADIDPDVTLEQLLKDRTRLEDGGRQTIERHHQRKDGTIFPIEITFSIGTFEDIKYVCAFVRNISERKEAARQAEELQFVINNAMDAMYLCDKDAEIYYVNETACQTLGYSIDELTSLNIFDIDTTYPRERWQKNWDAARQGNRQTFETYHTRKDGSSYPVEISIRVMEFEGIELAASFVRDITDRKRSLEKLHNSEARFRSLFDDSAIGMVVLSPNNHVEMVNDAFCRILGYTEEQVIGRTAMSFTHPDDIDIQRPQAEKLIAGELDHYSIEKRYLHQDGRTVWANTTISLIRNEADQVQYFIAQIQDITEAKLAARQMEQLRFAIEKAVDPVYMYNHNAEFQYVNASACQALGYSYDELTSMTIFDIDPDFTPERWNKTYDQISKGGLLNFETSNQRKDGSTFLVEVTANHMTYEGIEYGFSFNRDITKRKEVERRLQFTQFAVDSAGDGVWLTNAHGDILYANDYACQSLGYTQEELLNKTVRDLDPSLTDNDWNNDDLWASIADGEAHTFETVHRHKDGTDIPTEVTSKVLEFDGEVFSCSFTRDITERKQTQEALQNYQEKLEDLVETRTEELQAAQEELISKERLAVLGQLTGIVSHELRNPLGTIRTSLYLLRENTGDPTGPVQRAFDRAERNIVRCDKIIDELLDYTRTRPLELQLLTIDVWLAALVDEYETPSAITLELQMDAGVQVRIEPERFRRCIINLLSNACEAIMENPDNKPKILRVSTCVETNRLNIRIEDSGSGISEELKEKIFEPLFSTKGFGIGLGLAIVKQIITQHNGSIDITSKEGEGTQGTQVSLSLPLA